MVLTIKEQIIYGWITMAVAMAAMWLLQCRTKNAGIVDVVWAGGLGGLALFYALTSSGDGWRRLLLALLAGFWSLRLTVYLFKRVVGKPEDGRYQMLRRSWGPKANPYLFGFFQLQASWDILFSLSFLVVAHHPGGLDFWVLPGLLFWLISVIGESIADAQLARFRENPANRGKTCREGLWRYSRHPNYFFEWLHWWSYVFLSIGSSALWLSLLVTFIMILFLLKITGIPYTEKQALETRGEDYRQYQRQTSVFIPWFPKKEQS